VEEAMRIERALAGVGYSGWTSIEMRRVGDNLAALDVSLARLVQGAAAAATLP
jgi:sugar phosphate isomerase/epimerase